MSTSFLNPRLKATLFVICYGLLTTLGNSTTYYVRNGGVDSNSGLDDANAWASLAKVAATTLSAGDSILFKKGSVWSNNSLTIANVSGTSSSYITFGSYGTDPIRPKILRNLPRDGYCAKFTDCSYLMIQGLDLGVAGTGIWVNTAISTQAGIKIDDCYIHDIYGYNYYFPSTVLPGQYPMAINVRGVDGVTISNCTSYNAGTLFGSTGSGPNFGPDSSHLNTTILNKNLLISGCLADRNIYYGLAVVNTLNGLVQNCTITQAGSMPMVNGSTGILLGFNNGVTLSNVTVTQTDKYFFMSYPGSTSTSTAPDGGGIDFEISNQNVDLDHCHITYCSQEGVMFFNNSGSTHNLCDVGYTELKYNNLTPSQTRPEIWFSQTNSDNNSIIHDNTYWLMPGDTFITSPLDSSVTVTANTNSTATELAPTVPASPTGFAVIYNFTSGLDGWTFTNFKYSGQHGKYWGGYAGGIFNNTDPYMVSPDNVGTSITSYNLVAVKFRNLSASTTAKIYFTTTTSTTFSEAKSVSFNVNPYDTQSTTYTVDMSTNASWTGTLKQLRFDPTGSEWDMADVDYIGIFGPTTITLDNTAGSGVTITGTWTASTVTPGYYGTNYLHDGNTGGIGGKSVKFSPNIVEAGNYSVYLRWTSATNRASNAPVDVVYAGGTSSTLSINQTLNGGAWVLLGIYNFDVGTAGNVKVRNDGANSYVVADAVQFVRKY